MCVCVCLSVCVCVSVCVFVVCRVGMVTTSISGIRMMDFACAFNYYDQFTCITRKS